jgi:hypothetical protein
MKKLFIIIVLFYSLDLFGQATYTATELAHTTVASNARPQQFITYDQKSNKSFAIYMLENSNVYMSVCDHNIYPNGSVTL